MKINKNYLSKEQKALITGRMNYIKQLRKAGYTIDANTKEIICDHKSIEEFHRGPRYYADKLLKLGYVVQLKAV